MGAGEKSRAGGRQRPEKAIQRAILAFLATVPGVTAWKSGSGAFRLSYRDRAGQTRERFVVMGKRGVPDIVGWRITDVGGHFTVGGPCDACRAGDKRTRTISDGYAAAHVHVRSLARFLAIEVKRPGERPTPEQAAFLEAVRTAGGIAVVATCVADVASALGVGQEA